ncbi:magnesium/cobalt transporter CorA [Aureivirga sp. CE67]|uniref:magnesium/cobalt transporter CorA n=1 Tax=Aureivirga sp. CE67 TaxID=1788983 RepID=UPI0018CB1DE1|nr:magnesium/cobalt transporter CorA [Aureivirga sp. CE67]
MIEKVSGKMGLPPGALVYVGKKRSFPTKVDYIGYDNKQIEFEKDIPVERLKEIYANNNVNWIDVRGLHNVEIIQEIGEFFKIDNLHLEDILNTEHRPKIEETEHYILLCIKTISIRKSTNKPKIRQLSVVLFENCVITFQEEEECHLHMVKERAVIKKGNILNYGNDFLMYSIIDLIIDEYFGVIDKFHDSLEELESKIFNMCEEESLILIQDNKKYIIHLRRAIFPIREEIFVLMKHASDLITSKTLNYFHDIYEHIYFHMESLENIREINAGLKDLYLSKINLRMNQIMQTLTIFASIFIPLTFISGFYGMNFENMPELTWKYGYFATIAVMIITCVLLLIYFRRRKWL